MAEEQTEQPDQIAFTAAGIDLTDVEVVNADPIVRYMDIDVEKITYAKVQELKVKEDKKKKGEEEDEEEDKKKKKKKTKEEEEEDQKYKRIYIKYKHGDDEKEGFFYYEGYEMTAVSGLKCRVQKGKASWSVFVVHRLEDDAAVEYVNKYTEMYNHTAEHIYPIRGTLKMRDFSVEKPQATGLKYPIVTPFDEETCEPIEGESPFEWLNLILFGRNKTKFTFPGAKKEESIPWQDLIGVRFKFIPCMHFSHVHIGGGKMSIQNKLSSAVITDILPLENIARNIGTADALAVANPELEAKIRSQLDKIRNIKAAEASPDAGKAEVEAQATASGVDAFKEAINKQKAPSNEGEEEGEEQEQEEEPPKPTPSKKFGVTPSVKKMTGDTPKISAVPGSAKGKKMPAKTPGNRQVME